jgi:Fic family protein
MKLTNVLDESSRPEGRGKLVTRDWQTQLAGIGGRRSRQGSSYDAYVPAPIADEDFSLTSHAAAAAANAENAARELNERPPAIRNLEALARQLLRAESVASSRIEGLLLSHRRLARAAVSSERDLNAESVLANIAAMVRALDLASHVEELRTEHIIDVHRELFLGTRDEHLAGLVREEQNWIGGEATSPRNAEFVPPPPEYVPDLLDDLSAFLNREDIPAVVQAAIAHAQFESIHPFPDGNGRVGRALVLALLRRRGVAPHYLPPISLVLAGQADRYIAGLTSWRFDPDSDDWLLVFADATWRAATGAADFVEAVAELQVSWIEQAGSPRRNSAPLRLIELLPSHPIVNVSDAAHLLKVTDEAARLAITRLEGADVLRQVNVGKRNRAWETVGLFDLLDRFERELGPAHRTPRPTN